MKKKNLNVRLPIELVDDLHMIKDFFGMNLTSLCRLMLNNEIRQAKETIEDLKKKLPVKIKGISDDFLILKSVKM